MVLPSNAAFFVNSIYNLFCRPRLGKMGELWPRGFHVFFVCAVIRPTEEEAKTSVSRNKYFPHTHGFGANPSSNSCDDRDGVLSFQKIKATFGDKGDCAKKAASDLKYPVPLSFRTLPTTWAIGLHSFFQSPDKPNLAIACIFLSAPKKRWCFGLFYRKIRSQFFALTDQITARSSLNY